MTPLERIRYIRTLRTPGIPKSLLFVLASHADRDGLAWPSRKLLAAETGHAERSVYAALEWLAHHGLLIQRKRRGRSTVFLLTLEQFQLAAGTPATIAAPPRQPLPTEVAYKKMTKKQRKPNLIRSTPKNVVGLFPEANPRKIRNTTP